MTLGFTSNLENFNLVFYYNSMLCFCNPRNIYHKNTESHESTKILTLEIFRLYTVIARPHPYLEVNRTRNLTTISLEWPYSIEMQKAE